MSGTLIHLKDRSVHYRKILIDSRECIKFYKFSLVTTVKLTFKDL